MIAQDAGVDDEVRTLRRRLEQAPADDALRAAFVKALQRAGGDWLLVAAYQAGARCAPGELEALVASARPVLIAGGAAEARFRLAEALHHAGSRPTVRFVEVSVPAVPEHLHEATLFGVLTGEMTGRHNDRPGLLEVAAGGTLFVAGADELTARAQVALVRALDEGRFQQVVTGAWLPLTARLIAGAAELRPGPLVDRLASATLRLA